MDKTKIEYFKEYISQLPPGNITYKTINGKRYPYYQWTDKETGKMTGIDYEHCKGCGVCTKVCPFGAYDFVENSK